MFSQLLRSIVSRILFALVAGLIFALLIEVIFSIQYRNHVIFGNPLVPLGAIVITFLFVEIAFRINKVLNKKVPWGNRPLRRSLIQTLIHLLLAFFLVTGVRILSLFLFDTFAVILLSDEITILAVTAFIVLMLNLLDFSAMLLDQWRISLAEAEKYRKESAEFEYEMLRAQVNPHFLFNSLNTLSSLVYEDRDKAAEFIRKLSDVYRYVLDNRGKDLIELSREVEFTESYVYLLKLRFDEKLRVKMKIKDDLLKRKIAPLTLQLLIENAVKHNIVSSKRPLNINIEITDNYLRVENGLQKKQQKGRSTGMGLQNIKNRYLMLTDREVKVEEDGKTFKVEIPLI